MSLDIVWCPVKFRNYLKLHGTRTAFCRDHWGLKLMTSAGPGRRPAGVYIHLTGTGRFLLGIVRTDVWKAPGAFEKLITKSADARQGHGRCPTGHRPMFYESNCHRWEATCICRSTYRIYIDISLLKTKNINTKIYISFEQLSKNCIQQTRAIDFL